MPIGFRVVWVLLVTAILIIMALTTGCSVAEPSAGIVESNNQSQGPTVEVRFPRKKDLTPDRVALNVTRGDVYVIVVDPGDAERVWIVARNVFLSDNSAEDNLIAYNLEFITATRVLSIEVGAGSSASPNMSLDTHVYVRAGVPLDINAMGSLRIAGSVGAVTATVGGAVDSRGTTQNLRLTAQGGIMVDQAHSRLNLRAENGPIEILAEGVNVNASTNAGEILFIGSLLAGDNTFSTTTGSNITVVLPRMARYAITAHTTRNTIDVEFPALAWGRGFPVCGTFDSGAPSIVRTVERDHEQRGQLTFNMGDVRSAGLAELKGVVTQDYFAFHSSTSNLLVEIPQVSEFFVQTLPGTSASAAPPANEDPLKSFMGTPNPNEPAPITLPSLGGYPMHPAHCPITPTLQMDVRILAESQGGHIRIYQNLK